MELFLVNFLIIGIIYYLDVVWFGKQLSSKMIYYEKIENIRPENKQALIEDLRNRTGLKVVDADVTRIDFLSDSARLTIHYESDNEKAYSKAGQYDY